MWHYGIWIHSFLTSAGVSTPLGLPGQCGIGMHQHSTSDSRRRRRIRRHSTYWHMVHCEGVGLTSSVDCVNDMIFDIRERNVTIRSEIWTTNIRSLGFQDIREWVTLWGLILWSLRCTSLWKSSTRLTHIIVFLVWIRITYSTRCEEPWIIFHRFEFFQAQHSWPSNFHGSSSFLNMNFLVTLVYCNL